MSRLEELIQQLCPDGVEYRPFGEMAMIVRGASPRPIKNFITTRADGVNWIKIGDVKPDSKYITETAEKITPDGAKKSRFVRVGDFILSNSMSFGRPYIMKTEGCIHDGWLAISNFNCFFIADFLYHLLNSNQYQSLLKQKASFGGAVQNLNADIVRGLMMPVVPLEVQQEIVRILDSFTELTAELAAELTAELTARRMQYEYYLEKVLSFGESIPRLKIEALCSVITDGSHFSPNGVDAGYCMPSVKDMRSDGFNYSDCKQISEQDYNALVTNGCQPLAGDVLVAKDGAMLKHAFVFSGDKEVVVLSSIAILRPRQDLIEPKYMAYYFRQKSFKENVIRQYSTRGGVPRIILKNFKKVEIAVPPKRIQREIISILDRFDTLCNDLTSGLPAEIEARRKQYEYYRDKLLTFPKRNA